MYLTDRDRHSFLDPSPLRKDSVLWIYGDSVSEQFFWGVRPRPLCTHVFKWCGHTYNWIYQLKGDYGLEIKLKYLERKPRQPWLVFTWVLYPDRIGIWRCWFLNCGEKKTGEPADKPSEQDENQ